MEESEQPEATRWSIAAEGLLNAHVDPDRKIVDGPVFQAALVKALSDAYELGLKDGLVTKATGPDA